MLENNYFSLLDKDSRGYTALNWAIAAGNVQLVKYLLNQGKLIEQQINKRLPIKPSFAPFDESKMTISKARYDEQVQTAMRNYEQILNMVTKAKSKVVKG